MSLLPQHEQLIDGSAISAEVAAARGYRSVTTKAELDRLGFGRSQLNVPALLMPLHGIQGEIAGYLIRPDEPRQIKGRICKYEMPSGGRMMLDIPPAVRDRIDDPTVPLFITEGSRKADAAASRGLACVALIGVWAWRGTNLKGGKIALPEFESIALNDREVYVVFDSDVMTKESVHSALARLSEFLKTRQAKVNFIYLPPGAGAVKVGLDDFLAAGGTVEDLMKRATPRLREMEGIANDAQYEMNDGGITWNKDSEHRQRLTNFAATIIGEVTIDDGVEVEQYFEIEASLHGRTKTFSVEAQKFPLMHWPIEQLGAGAILEPGQGTKDRIRHAIQTLSDDIVTRVAYGHLGWQEIDGENFYLHAGGAIGAKGSSAEVEVAVSEPLRAFVLPDPPDGESRIRAIRATLSLVDLVKAEIAYVLIGLLGRAPLGGFDSTVWIFGETGTFKSELAALCQQHWGAGLDARHLPSSFSSSANFIEGLLFEAKDTVTVIDDFAPDGTSFDMQKAHKEIARLLRGQGNSQGRGRMRADIKLRPPKPSRSCPLITAEELPQGHSIRARSTLLGVEAGDVDPERLTELQGLAAAGVLAESLAAYISYLAEDYDRQRETLGTELITRRAELAGHDGHARTPAALAELQIGLERFIGFAEEARAISPEEAERHFIAGSEAIREVGRLQRAHLSSGEPAARFISLLGSVISSGAGHIADPSGAAPEEPNQWGWRQIEVGGSPTWREQGSRIGWTDGEDLWLDPDASLAAVQELARRSAQPFPISNSTLAKRLSEKGFLASTDLDTARNCVPIRKVIGGVRKQVLHLKAKQLITEIAPTSDGRGGRDSDPGGPKGDGGGDTVAAPPTHTEGQVNGGEPDQPDQIELATPGEEAEIRRLNHKFSVQDDEVPSAGEGPQ